MYIPHIHLQQFIFYLSLGLPLSLPIHCLSQPIFGGVSPHSHMQAFIPTVPFHGLQLNHRLGRDVQASPRRPRLTVRASATPAVRGSSDNPYRIAVLSGDGAGPSIANAVKKILSTLASTADLHFEFRDAPYGADAFSAYGTLVPDETLDICCSSDAVLRSYQGTARGIGPQASAHIQLRDKLGLFAQFRPAIVYPQLASVSTLRPSVISNVDIMLVREISGGALGVDYAYGDGEASSSQISYSEDQIAEVAKAALKVAEYRGGRILNVDKADAMPVSRFWRRVLHETIEKEAEGNDGIILSDMYVDDFVREVIHRPLDFDTVVTSNLFGDICAEVLDALAGPLRLSPSFWKNRDGLGVYGPADLYNLEAYPKADDSEARGVSAIALTRAASMMLRYELDEPAAANMIQQALRKTMGDLADDQIEKNTDFGEDVSSTVTKNGNGSSAVTSLINTDEYADVFVRSMQLLRQYEELCDPTECGE